MAECSFKNQVVLGSSAVAVTSKYQYLVNKREGVGINQFKDPKVFIEYSNDMHDVYENIDDYNPDKENKI